MERPATIASPLCQAAVDGFRTHYGTDPEGVWSAPGRVNLIGEHTDYNDGLVLPIAIDRRTWVTVGRRTDRAARVASASAPGVVEHDVDAISPGAVAGWSAYPLGTAWGIRGLTGNADRATGFDAYFTSDVPLGAGLSSSAAIECALATALADVWQLGLTGEQLLHATHQAENVIVGAPTGILDQSAALFAQAGHALFIDCRQGSRESIPFAIAEAGLSLAVIDTRISHAHADGGYRDRRASCEQAAAALGVPALRDATRDRLDSARDRLDEVTYRRARHVITENERVKQAVALLRTEGPRAIGELLVASHASMRDDFEISVPQLDTAVEAALAAGALGARMTGGGFGGAAIALLDSSRMVALREGVHAAFAQGGFVEPVIFAVSPASGARRDR